MREVRNPTYQRVQELLRREHVREQRSELYSLPGITRSLENDEISSVEEGFMQGYLAA